MDIVMPRRGKESNGFNKFFSDVIMDYDDCEFLAEDTKVTIIPNFNGAEIHLFAETVGPFEAGDALNVPVWLALHLKRKHKCKIAPPEWLNIETLKRMIATETDSPALSSVPEHYVEITKVILNKAADDIADADQLMTLVMDLMDRRSAKMRTSIQKFVSQADTAHAALNNLTRLEAAHFRPFLEEATAKIDILNEHRHLISSLNNTQ